MVACEKSFPVRTSSCDVSLSAARVKKRSCEDLLNGSKVAVRYLSQIVKSLKYTQQTSQADKTKLHPLPDLVRARRVPAISFRPAVADQPKTPTPSLPPCLRHRCRPRRRRPLDCHPPWPPMSLEARQRRTPERWGLPARCPVAAFGVARIACSTSGHAFPPPRLVL